MKQVLQKNIHTNIQEDFYVKEIDEKYGKLCDYNYGKFLNLNIHSKKTNIAYKGMYTSVNRTS